MLILDLMLPDSDGLKIARQLRADPATAALPILMLTARVEDTDRIVGLELGADDYVPKPFSPRELVARVRAIGVSSTPGAGSCFWVRLPVAVAEYVAPASASAAER